MSRTVLNAALGLCEHCGVLLDMSSLPPEAMDAVWKCPKCGKELTGKSLGYDPKHKKVHWVGPDGRWSDIEPEEDFSIGDLSVVMRMPAFIP